MKIVIVSRDTWPHQGPRAFRTSELSEELVRQGHDVTVYAVLCEANYDSYTKSTGVKVCPILMKNRMNRNGKEHRYNNWDRVLYHLFRKIADFPLYEFKYRVRDLLSKEKNIDLLITIAAPHEIHFGGAAAKIKNPGSFAKCWIADCGDPFMYNPYQRPIFYFAREEKKWCNLVDYIAVPVEEGINGYYPEFRNKIKVIPQGFDFDKTPIGIYKPNTIPSFAYAGQFYPGLRDPSHFLDYLVTLKEDFRCVFFIRGDVPQKYHTLLGEKLVIHKNWSRKDIIFELSKMDFLINIPNKGSTVQVPSKLIDYAIAKRPVLNVETDFSQQEVFKQFLNGYYSGQLKLPNLDNYDIKRIAKLFLDLAKQKLLK